MKPVANFKEVIEKHKDIRPISFGISTPTESFYIVYAKISPIELTNLALQSSTDYLKSGNEIEAVWVTDHLEFETTPLSDSVALAAIDWPAQRITVYAVRKGAGTNGKRLGQAGFSEKNVASYTDFSLWLTEVLRQFRPDFIHR